MLKVKEGDLEKASLLYSRYSRRLFGFFYRMVSNGAISEDLVQNVFMRVIKYKHTYSEDGKFETWLFQLARNVHHDHYRKEKRYLWQENMSEWEGQLKEDRNVEKSTIADEEIGLIGKALKMLDPQKRELIELTRFQKLKYEEVATLLGISEGAVKVRMHRTIKELKENYLKLEAS